MMFLTSETQSGDSDPLPRSFKGYTLVEKIARGGMATIYLAAAQGSVVGSRRIAIKRIHSEFSSVEMFAEMFIHEAKLAAQLHHSGIVQVYDLGREDGHLFIAMEFVEGFDFNRFLQRLSKLKVSLPLPLALFVIEEVLRALDYAHRARSTEGIPLGIVHRDLSPSNVLLSTEGEVKLCDFGIAKAFGVSSRIQEDGLKEEFSALIMGKSAYMAPEQARGEEVDARADIYSTGVLLWEVCSGRRMHRGDSKDIFSLVQHGERPVLSVDHLPSHQQIKAVVDKALSLDPATRWQSASEMRNALSNYIVDAGLEASSITLGKYLREQFSSEFERQRQSYRPYEYGGVRSNAETAQANGVIAQPSRSSPLPQSPTKGGSNQAGSKLGFQAMKVASQKPKTSPLVLLGLAVGGALLICLLWVLGLRRS